MANFRTEHDLLGELAIPSDALYGIHTARALANFRISGRVVSPALVRALAQVKKACALANRELGFQGLEKCDAICRACDEIVAGQHADQFPLDALQGGAGTSTNMNLNEVIANRALELLGAMRGDYAKLHPIEDVNLHQSTNDVYPTALKVAAIFGLRELSAALATLQGAFQKKEKEFSGIVKLGRTEMQDAVPMTMGAEFSAFAEAFARDRWRTFKAEERLRVVNLGGTALGTGLTASRSYIFLVIEKLREVSGLGLTRAENLVDATANADCFAEVAGILNACAANFIKIARDLRLLHMLGEIRLPPVQAGSSLMPGKINPVIAEATVQAGMQARAAGALVAEVAASGTLQINEYLPLLAASLLDQIALLKNAAEMLASHVAGITAAAAACRRHLDHSRALINAFLPRIGYEQAQRWFGEFNADGGNDLRAFLIGKLGRAIVEQTLSPENLTALGYREKERC
ncbi:MAG: aspartate ammonia-lyase [Verrucomicrobia bacterium]|nr:MAG: aspartate ammonia-lyase [Verrucomicrobiota bacterium]